MKTVDETYAANLRRPLSTFETCSHELLLSKIGDDLRGFYGDLMDSDQPSNLVDLAGRLDDLIAGRGFEGA